MPVVAACAAAILVAALLVRARCLARFRLGEVASAPFLLGSTLVVAVIGLGVAVWVALRAPVLGLPLLFGVALLAGLWIRQTGTYISSDGRVGQTTQRSGRLLASVANLARLGSAMLLSLGFAGLVASLVYLLFRSRF